MQFDLFDQGADSQPGGRQTDLEMMIEENSERAARRAQHIDTFPKRVAFAAAHMAAGRPVTRGLDNCFENYDGEAVAHALFRRAARNPNGKLAQNIENYLCGEINSAPKKNGPNMSDADLRAMSLKNFEERAW